MSDLSTTFHVGCPVVLKETSDRRYQCIVQSYPGIGKGDDAMWAVIWCEPGFSGVITWMREGDLRKMTPADFSTHGGPQP